MFETDCAKVLRQIELYLDGELASVEREVVERHIAGCSPCFERQEFRRSLMEVVRRKCRSAELPPGLADRVRRSLEHDV